jgi:hypothetical protein
MALAIPFSTRAQKTVVVDSSQPGYRTVISGEEYDRSGLHQLLWGKHYRKEWTTPVRVPVIDLSTFEGGLKPIEQGGGRQTKTLRLVDKKGRQYVLRSIDKDYGKALPDIVHGTFIESLAKDQVSTAHPFSSVTVPLMIDAAGVYHTNPHIFFVPYSPVLDSFNTTFANTLCLLEERPDDDESTVASFGNSEKVRSTEKMYEKVFGDNDHRVDQKAFVRARLFDMFLGDWGRHDDQWRWAEFDSSDYTIYRPIPRDRDQAYTRFEGFLLKRILSNEELEHLRTFSGNIRNVKKYNFPARYIDRQLTNEVSRQTWMDIAGELQSALTDDVIEKSIHQLPPELFAISGNSLIADLKSRRGHLKEFAAKYYRFLTQQVEIVGTEKDELFEVVRSPHETTVSLYDLGKDNKPRKKPFYSRTFFTKETQELRLYGLKGNDVFRVSGNSNSIRVRIIGGPQKDSMVNESGSASHLKYYDNEGNDISGPVHEHLSSDTSINAYNYEAFKYNSGHTIKSPSYSNTRGIFVAAGYTYTRYQWRKQPFGWKQTLAFNYSISNNSFGGEYQAGFNQVFGRWNLLLAARYDQRLKNYYFGVGNETTKERAIEYYQMFMEEAYTTVGLNHLLGRNGDINIAGFYQSVNVKEEDGHFIDQHIPSSDPTVFNKKDFAGALANIHFLKVNDLVVPTKGAGFSLEASYTKNLTQTDRSFMRYVGTFGFYLPLIRNVSLAVRTGASHMTGDPEFYQLNWLGGGQNLRGFHRQRFFGKSAFYDDNELRWLPDVRTHLFNGKMGLVAFLDNGRVWNPGEDSDKWHIGYGGGVLIAPFNKIALTVYYGKSDDDGLVHIRIGRFF